MVLREIGRVLMGIGCLVLAVSAGAQMYLQDERWKARLLERARTISQITPEADASYESLIVIGWIGIGIGAVWVLASITCFLTAQIMEQAESPASETEG
ncbi:hypothetical protein [Streptosporangium carneum]|uniref:Uncharacterized protein n=1 Tax=Streptosporangium carneum TaxID=47481 RepID=A0A9W6MFR6_9ACTN|nr:hypothetical protein [Streptosporangium carneum]GLK12355.1 hypothetical protein GCM10017600_57650 [Streptosporangium carneum]